MKLSLFANRGWHARSCATERAHLLGGLSLRCLTTSCTKLRRGEGALEGWGCVSDCGACCWSGGRDVESHCVDEESTELFRSMVDANGWCIHLDSRTRLCTIYDRRPDFCQVEASDWDSAPWEPPKKPLQVAAEARAACRALIRAVHGEESDVMARYKREWPEPKP